MPPAASHRHEQGLHLQPLPSCLAPTEPDRAALAGLALPRPGEQVVLNGAHVHWLTARRPARPHTFASVLMWTVPLYGREVCEGAGWDEGHLYLPDPNDPWVSQDTATALRSAARLLLDHANTTRTGTLFPYNGALPASMPYRVDPRVAAWTITVLDDAADRLEAAEDLTGEIERAARAVTGAQEITDEELVRQVVHAAHAAIALVFLTEYRRLVVLDPEKVADPSATIAAVQQVYAEHPRELRPWLARQAAVKVAVGSAAVD